MKNKKKNPLEKLSKEELGRLILLESSTKKIWDNPKDEEVWKEYL